MDNDHSKTVHKKALDGALIHAIDLPQDMGFVLNEQGQVQRITNVVEAVPVAYINTHVTLNKEVPDAYIDPHITLYKQELSGIHSSDQQLNGTSSSDKQQIQAPIYIRHKNPFPDYEFTPEQGQELLSILRGITGKPHHSPMGKHRKGRPRRLEQVIPEFEYGEIPGPLVRAEDIFVEPSNKITVPRGSWSESELDEDPSSEQESGEPVLQEDSEEEWNPSKGKKRKSLGLPKSKSGKRKYTKRAKETSPSS